MTQQYLFSVRITAISAYKLSKKIKNIFGFVVFLSSPIFNLIKTKSILQTMQIYKINAHWLAHDNAR